MSKSFSSILHGLALIALLVGCVLLYLSSIGSVRVTNAFGGNTTAPTNTPFFIIGLVLVTLSILVVALFWAMKFVRVQR